MGVLLLALVFFASGGMMIAKAREAEKARTPAIGREAGAEAARAKPARGEFMAMPGRRKLYLGVFMLVLGGMVTVYAVLTMLT